MTIEEIRTTCIKSSELYYNYLKENKKGVFNIKIRKITKVSENKIKLKISHKIFDEETIVFKHLPTNQDWTIESVKIQVYDRDTNTLVIKPTEEIYQLLVQSHTQDWLIVSDLKFLIERVKDWYIANGQKIAMLSEASKLDPPEEALYFNDEKPSDEQRRSLQIIFDYPFSYIWGAPGTGKTQFVLSYAILQYLGNKKKVAIIAPTNHALEQIFRGVIKMTDKAGIKRNDILRLGGPSKKFADEFPEVCEIIGLENQLKQINDQISTIENILGIDEYSKEQDILNNALKQIQALCIEKEKKSKIEFACEELQKLIEESKQFQRECHINLDINKKESDVVIRKKNSFLYSIVSILSKKIDFDQKLKEIIKSRAAIEQELEKSTSKRKKLITQYQSKLQLKEQSGEKINSLLNRFQTVINKSDGDLTDVSLDTNLKRLTINIEGRIEEIDDKRPVYSTLADEYKNQDNSLLIGKLEKLRTEKERFENYSTEHRLKNISIVGATLDTYLYRFKSEKLNVDHIFLDEAGYSNIVKALTLFNQGVPVTFLGDHMQLPPVCEISKRAIQENENFRPVMVWDQSAIYLEDLFELTDLDLIVSRYLNNKEATFDLLKKSNLTATFRFGNSLARVLGKYVYHQGFTSNLDTGTEIIIYNVKNPVDFRNNSRKNEAEVLAITSLLQHKFNPESDVAILAPYVNQIMKLSNKLPEYHQNNKLMTVHKSQGQEWDTIIYSVCDPGNGKKPWFTDSENSLSGGLNNINTAISRAKKRLILVCDSDEWSLRSGQLINGLLQAATNEINLDE